MSFQYPSPLKTRDRKLWTRYNVEKSQEEMSVTEKIYDQTQNNFDISAGHTRISVVHSGHARHKLKTVTQFSADFRTFYPLLLLCGRKGS